MGAFEELKRFNQNKREQKTAADAANTKTTEQSDSGAFAELKARNQAKRAKQDKSTTSPVKGEAGGTATQYKFGYKGADDGYLDWLKNEQLRRTAGLDLDGAAEVYAEISRLNSESARQQKQVWDQSEVGKKITELEQRKAELSAGLDLDGAAAVQAQIDKLHWDNGTHGVQRVGNILSGSAKQMAAAWGDTQAVLYEAGQKLRDTQDQSAVEEYKLQYDEAERAYNRLLADNAAKPGTWSEGDLESYRNVMAAAKLKLDALGYVMDNDVQQKAATAARDFNLELSESGTKDIERAKEGLGGVGRFAVDAGTGLLQLGGDMAAGTLTGGGATIPLLMRSFGGGTMRARQDGASVAEQIGYGGLTALAEVLTEKIGSVGRIQTKAFGKGGLDDILEGVVAAAERAGKTPAGRAALNRLASAGTGFLSEGLEEAVSAAVEPVIAEMTYGKELPNIKQLAQDVAYDFLVGGTIGAVTGGVGGTDTGTMQRSVGVVTPDAEQQGTKNAVSGEETASKYDAAQAAEIQHEGKTFRNLVVGFDTKVSEFFDRWRSGRKSHQGEKLEKLYMGKMPLGVKAKVADLLGYEVDERDFIVTNDDVKHVFDHHGDPEHEIEAGNIPLELWMFDALPDVLANPDSITPGHVGESRKNSGKRGVLFSKAFPGGTVITVQYDNPGRKTMGTATIYAKNKGATSELYAPVETDTSAVRPGRSEPAPIVNTTIPHPADSVNSGAVQGFGENGTKVVAEIARNSGATIQQVQNRVGLAYQTGRSNLPGTLLDLTDADQRRAYNAGKMDFLTADRSGGKDLVNGQETRYTETEGAQSNEEVHLRGSGQRADGTHSSGAISAVESRTGGNQVRQEQSRPADPEAASLTYGEAVSTASLGIGKGSDKATIRVVTGGDTADTRAAKQLAKERGLRLTLFVGGNLNINGESVRAYITGDRAFVRADHPDFTSAQLMRHEAGHDMIAKGEIDPQTVRERIAERFGGEHLDHVTQMYIEAYAGSGLTAEEVWEEVICDSLGDMNIFSETASEDAARELLTATKAASADAKAETRRGPPAATGTDAGGKMSVELNDLADNIQKGSGIRWNGGRPITLSKSEYAAVVSRISSRYHYANTQHDGVQIIDRSTDGKNAQHYVYLYTDHGFGSYQIIGRLTYGRNDALINFLREEIGNDRTAEGVSAGTDRLRNFYEHTGGSRVTHYDRTSYDGNEQADTRSREVKEESDRRTGRADTGRYDDGSHAGTVTSKTSLELERPQVERAAERYSALIEEYGAIAPGENPARHVQVPKQTTDNQKVSQTVRTILEAGATPEEVIPDIERLVADGDFSYEKHTDKQAISNAENTIRRVGWAQALSDWMGDVKSGTVSKKNTAMGWALYNNAANSGDVQTAITILDQMVAHQRSAAQALQATRILKKLSPEIQLYQVQRSVENLQEELNERFGEKGGPALKVDEELAGRFMQAKDQVERDAVLKEIYRDIGRQMPSTFRDKWNAWRYLAMLCNARTHVRNIVGNAGFAPVVMAKNLTASAIEEAVYRVSGGRMERSKSFVGIGKQYWRFPFA